MHNAPAVAHRLNSSSNHKQRGSARIRRHRCRAGQRADTHEQYVGLRQAALHGPQGRERRAGPGREIAHSGFQLFQGPWAMYGRMRPSASTSTKRSWPQDRFSRLYVPPQRHRARKSPGTRGSGSHR